MSAPSLGDADLLAQHVAGDPNAFGELVVRHRDRMWAVALRTLGNPDDAADAVQDALLSAYRGAAGFRGNSAVTTWLHRIVVNACLDLTRRRAVRPTQPLLIEPATNAPDAISRRDTAITVTEALRSLPAEQAAAVVLVDIEGFSVDEAAQILDVPTGTVKSRCARGRARLAEQLHDLDPRRDSGTDRNDVPSSRVESLEPTKNKEKK
ncbi:MAG TPA: RNA polymerase sigma factor SigM [Mycobacteriales bacterium]|jgi:RNA polymerase sigma-70 factor (ECF subfamily)|nr:RNA polymerase sigma factor SigM [Mycobacteriales bacterium]